MHEEERWGNARVVRLSDILSVERVTTALEKRPKDEVLRALAGLFTDLSADEVHQVFRAREALASTGIGSGVAVPHGRLGSAERMEAALAVCAEGVDFDSVDGAPVHIFVALVAPDRHTGDHLRALARISRVLRDEGVRKRLVAAASAEEAYDILMKADGGPG